MTPALEKATCANCVAEYRCAIDELNRMTEREMKMIELRRAAQALGGSNE